MNRPTRYILAGIFAAIMACLLAASLNVSARRRGALTCSGLKVTISDSSSRSFVTVADIKGYLDKEFGGYSGKPVSELDLTKAEEIIDSKSAVLKSQVYMTKDGMLNVNVTQREPVIRFQKKDVGFYADSRGYIFPLQSNYTARVPIIDGELPISGGKGYKGMLTDRKELEWMGKVLEMVEYMNKEEVWAEDIVQITVNSDGDIVMVPREGKERFIFGSPYRYEEKFKLMELYYTGIKPEKEEDFYSTVNVKYENQIICRK